ncbi:DUF4349 domain-containing protein [Aureisphaera galaxeae]|uniref:DUF4349 domain-containing protein n=1 Tax=Aureisphaera galaxeae TaxID=1538023 RepID=UPI0023504C51|nr:DUF4349 domain-containing protein [Aureisphaera galaxeae]MDC8005115.1 DUF4349 domain-containing protein [Aureisphaera galaxeae]
MKFFSLLFVGLTIVACSDNQGIVAESPGDEAFADGMTFSVIESNKSSYDDVEYDKVGKVIAGEQTEAAQQKIIKTAQLEFETKDLEATQGKIQDLVRQHEGLVQNDNSGKSYNKLYQNVTVRVPSENFDAFVDGVSEGVEYFDRRDISQKDVSEEFVDLKARLKAKKELENRYLELLKKAKNVEEMLEIERELSNIREEIEAKQGRLEYLKNRVSLSTVTIHFYKVTAKTGVTVSYGQKMVNALKGGWDGISVFFLGILYLWPLFLIFGILFFILRRYLKRRKAKN